MKLLRTGLTAIALAASFAGIAQAAPSFDSGTSSIFFNNFENQYRLTASCTAATCFAPTVGDPAGYQRVNNNIAGNILVNDVYAGIINIQNITSATSGVDTYNSVAGDRFTGYFAQQVVSFGPLEGTTAHINLGTVADPFGILAAGEMFRLYSDTASFSSGGSGSDVTANIALATSGTFWASLGLSAEGFTYTHTNLALSATDPAATANENFAALDVLIQGPGYNAGLLAKINDFNENEIGGTIAAAASQLCSAAEIASATIRCNDIVGTSEIEANNLFGSTSPWMFGSNDPFEFVQAVPEPGTVVLMGLALVGLGVARRRQSS